MQNITLRYAFYKDNNRAIEICDKFKLNLILQDDFHMRMHIFFNCTKQEQTKKIATGENLE